MLCIKILWKLFCFFLFERDLVIGINLSLVERGETWLETDLFGHSRNSVVDWQRTSKYNKWKMIREINLQNLQFIYLYPLRQRLRFLVHENNFPGILELDRFSSNIECFTITKVSYESTIEVESIMNIYLTSIGYSVFLSMILYRFVT